MDEANERITTVEGGDTTVNERLSPGGPGPEGQADTADERLSGVDEQAAPDAAPAESASKADWVDYAVSKGADRDEAAETTKAELINQYG